MGDRGLVRLSSRLELSRRRDKRAYTRGGRSKVSGTSPMPQKPLSRGPRVRALGRLKQECAAPTLYPCIT